MEIQAIFTGRRLNHWAVTTSDGRPPVNLSHKRLHSNACRFASSLTKRSKFSIHLFYMDYVILKSDLGQALG